MSKAFTKESDDAPEVSVGRRPGAGLPPGTPNYLTGRGAQRFREELDRLIAQNPAAQEGSQQRERIRFLGELLRTAVVVQAPRGARDRVRLGARVRVRHPLDRIVAYRLVGVDETDPDHGDISYLSPLGQTLMHGRPGDHVQFEAPSGTEDLEILSVDFE